MTDKPLYPRSFLTPEGKPISIAGMARALRVIRANPSVDVTGWEWFPVSGHAVVSEFMSGLNDRINRRGDSHG